jgi:hypothetical protein
LPTGSDAVNQQEELSHVAGWSMSRRFTGLIACVSFAAIMIDPADPRETPAPLLCTDLLDATYGGSCSECR